MNYDQRTKQEKIRDQMLDEAETFGLRFVEERE